MAAIQFLEGKVLSLDLDANFKLEDTSDVGIESFGVEPKFFDDQPKFYNVLFLLSIITADSIKLELSYSASFKRDCAVDEEFRNSPFVFVNSPAIAYPFLRAIVSSILINCGYENTILPTINFQAWYNDEIKKEIDTDPDL